MTTKTNATNIYVDMDGHCVFTIESKRYGTTVWMIDVEDLPLVLKRRWTVYQPKNNVHLYLKSKDGDLHRIIMGTLTIPRGLCVNHISLDTHDNRRCNLEVVNARESAMKRGNNQEFVCIRQAGKSYQLNINIFGHQYGFSFKNKTHALYTHQRLISALGSRPIRVAFVDMDDYRAELAHLLKDKRRNERGNHILRSLLNYSEDKEALRHELSRLKYELADTETEETVMV